MKHNLSIKIQKENLNVFNWSLVFGFQTKCYSLSAYIHQLDGSQFLIGHSDGMITFLFKHHNGFYPSCHISVQYLQLNATYVNSTFLALNTVCCAFAVYRNAQKSIITHPSFFIYFLCYSNYLSRSVFSTIYYVFSQYLHWNC